MYWSSCTGNDDDACADRVPSSHVCVVCFFEETDRYPHPSLCGDVQEVTIAAISDEEFNATPAHLRGLDRVVDPNAPSFMASRSAMHSPLVVDVAFLVVPRQAALKIDTTPLPTERLWLGPIDAPEYAYNPTIASSSRLAVPASCDNISTRHNPISISDCFSRNAFGPKSLFSLCLPAHAALRPL